MSLSNAREQFLSQVNSAIKRLEDQEPPKDGKSFVMLSDIVPDLIDALVVFLGEAEISVKGDIETTVVDALGLQIGTGSGELDATGSLS